jgi:predicted ABC-type exoprotein transport system permease subunit
MLKNNYNVSYNFVTYFTDVDPLLVDKLRNENKAKRYLDFNSTVKKKSFPSSTKQLMSRSNRILSSKI